MRRIIVLSVIILIGVPVGYVLRGALTPAPDRVAIGIDLFETYCVPMVSGVAPQPDAALVPIALTGLETGWADAKSRFLLEIDERSCSVSDELAPLVQYERLAFQAAAQVSVATNFSQLGFTHNGTEESWVLLQAWTHANGNTGANWGIVLTRWANEGEDTATRLRLNLPLR